MRAILLLFILGASVQLRAQNFMNKSLQDMVDSEHAFARMAKEKNRRDAFLFYLSDDVITAGQDGPVKGKAEIEKQPITNDWLHWQVAFCDIASSGDLGYTTGPYEYRVNKTDEKPVGYGQFNSIWKKQSDGSWRNVLDIGTRHGMFSTKDSPLTSTRPLLASDKKKNFTKTDLIELERKFLRLAKTNSQKSYQKFLSSESRIIHTGRLPLINREEQIEYLTKLQWPEAIDVIDGGVASSQDLGYVYGVAQLSNGPSSKKATYLRVWKKEGKDWKIVLDVLSH